jgi:hypothetical protein
MFFVDILVVFHSSSTFSSVLFHICYIKPTLETALLLEYVFISVEAFIVQF